MSIDFIIHNAFFQGAEKLKQDAGIQDSQLKSTTPPHYIYIEKDTKDLLHLLLILSGIFVLFCIAAEIFYRS